ncbi:hypothetical protein ACFX19_047680 [Malus domestica]
MANYILNRVPTKAVLKTPYELWTGRKSSLNHLHAWGCAAEARMYNPMEKKLDSRTFTCYLVGFPERSKRFRFYTPSLPHKIIETGLAKFIEDNDEIQESDTVRGSSWFEEIGDVLLEKRIEILFNNEALDDVHVHGNLETTDQPQSMIEFQLDDFVQPTYENVKTETAESSSQTGNQPIESQATVEKRLLPPRTKRSAIPDDCLVYL